MKLNEIEATKGKSGSYYGIDEILGMDIEILEDISSNTDIREFKTKKDNLYYCMLIQYTEAKDLHLTKAALLAVAAALPKTESWKNYKIKINRTGKNFNTVYNITVLGKGISGYAAPSQNPPKTQMYGDHERSHAEQITDPAGQIVGELKSMVAGIHDSRFWDMVGKYLKSPAVQFDMVERLKQQGRIIKQPDGVWKAT